ncbi:hypothetical protein F2P56_010367 [Juglans regia]|uniref:Disease resistance RPP13-like protein 1 n=1 Tax=Juglans regia TaxID=51240 RepID=A0A833XR31_JUGRE|nr:hypothetical protein F2P56_010367 [Juglans regia]
MASPGVGDFICKQKSAKKLLEKMESALQSMNMVLEDAEEKQVMDSNVKRWIDKLKDVAYDAEDILDEIATEALQRQLRAQFKPVVGKVRNFISSTSLDPFIHRLEPKIQEVLDTLQDLKTQKNFLGLQAAGVGGNQYPERLTTSYVSESDTFGRDEDKKKVIDFLLSSDARGNEMCVIAIVGMGGIGKTTLAQLAYNDMSRVKQHFDLKMWFCVSEEFDRLKIMKSIIDQAATSSTRSIEDPEQLRVILENNLTGKKFLLVLDDVWSENPIHREFLSQLLHYGT